MLIPLVLWLGFALASLPLDHASLVEWVRQPLVTIALVLTVIVLFFHAQLGLQVVIEDYFASHAIRTVIMLTLNFSCLLFGIVGVVSVLKISFGA